MTICTSNSLAIHPGHWNLSHPFSSVERLSDFQPQTPVRGRGSAGSFPLAMGALARGHWAGGVLRTAQDSGDAGQWGFGVFEVPGPLLLGTGGFEQPWHRASPTQPLGAQRWFTTAKVCCTSTLFIQKNKQFWKSLSLWKALTLQNRGCWEAKSGVRYKSLHPSEFLLPDSHTSVYRNTGRWRKPAQSTSLLDKVTSS